ncbi:MAG TPA: response regulator transcription factor [Blastocatellia bacterium]|nr:response regulator transcription factor [Blastocatellia bacterium]
MACLLIVDDNENMRRLIKKVLQDFGTIHECSDGAEAFAAYTLHHPDWVIMDIHMPNVNGIRATQQIIAAYPDARVVILSKFKDAETREAARDAGACDYITKEDLLSLRQIVRPC